MKMPIQPSSSANEKDAMLSNIALLYYGEGLTQSEIAKRFKVSRVTIVNMLRDCRERGVVEIRVDGKLLAGSSLSRQLKEKFGLADVYISSESAETTQADRAAQLPQLARVAAMAMMDIVETGDRVGVAWGETIAAMASAMPRAMVENIEVCQLIGSQESDRVPASEFCAIEVANKLGATCHTLHAPGIVSSPELARAFAQEPAIKAQLARLSALDFTVASIGNVADSTHMVAAKIATAAELAAARAAGAVGIICCRYIDARGQEVTIAPSDRVIAASCADLTRPAKKLLVVLGEDRLEATRAAIQGGFVSHLVIDHTLGAALLAS